MKYVAFQTLQTEAKSVKKKPIFRYNGRNWVRSFNSFILSCSLIKIHNFEKMGIIMSWTASNYNTSCSISASAHPDLNNRHYFILNWSLNHGRWLKSVVSEVLYLLKYCKMPVQQNSFFLFVQLLLIYFIYLYLSKLIKFSLNFKLMYQLIFYLI